MLLSPMTPHMTTTAAEAKRAALYHKEYKSKNNNFEIIKLNCHIYGRCQELLDQIYAKMPGELTAFFIYFLFILQKQ